VLSWVSGGAPISTPAVRPRVRFPILIQNFRLRSRVHRSRSRSRSHSHSRSHIRAGSTAMKTRTAIILLALLLCGGQATVCEQNAPAKPDPNLLWLPLLKAEFKAAVHVRYYSYFAGHYEDLDADSKYWTFMVAILALILPFVIESLKIEDIWKWKGAVWVRRGAQVIAVLFGFYSMKQAVAYNSYPYNDLRSQHTVALQQWNVLKHDWSELRRDFPLLDYQQIAERMARNERTELAVENAEPKSINQEKMHEFQDQERKVQGLKKAPDIDSKKTAAKQNDPSVTLSEK
jgi:hypothetical protein